MFEQGEFAVEKSRGTMQVPQNTALRGTRYKDSFIPPKPVEAAQARDQSSSEGSEPYISSFHGAHAAAGRRPPSSPPQQQGQAPFVNRLMPEAEPTAPGLQLKPPKLQIGARKRNSPSLFERITGTVQQRLGDLNLRHDASPPPASVQPPYRQAPPGSEGAPQQHTPSPASQGRLNVDAPAAKPQPRGGDTELDIPAFLRRQAN